MDKIIEAKYVTITETSQMLGISTATTLNWAKNGYLTLIKQNQGSYFDFNEVINIKNKVENGEINRLNSRANKKNSSKTFVPDEYLDDPSNIPLFNIIKDFISEHDLEMEECLFMLSLNLLINESVVSNISLSNIKEFQDANCSNFTIYTEITNWHKTLNFNKKGEQYYQLLSFDIPETSDFLGAMYQSLLSEGDKSKAGSYYTPSNISLEIAESYISNINKNIKILDPCCGTGQFLLSAADIILKSNKNIKPQNIWGYDIDKIAIQIARMNLLIKFKDFEFSPNIHNMNIIENYSHNKNSVIPKDFDLIVGNPPWGAEIKFEQTTFLKTKFPKILTLESFSYFIYIGLNLLNSEGILSFILPESIVNIKSHKDIRAYILKESDILRIQNLGRVFRNVFTPVIRLDLKKSDKRKGVVKVINEEKLYELKSSRFNSNENKIFDIYNTPEDQEIISKVSKREHTTLANQADWALGIVTGNNDKFLTKQKKDDYEEIYKGKDVFKFYLNPAVKSYIKMEPDKFQQTPPIFKYRVKEKLIYRFISKKLIFAYDNAQKVTLNSANILIPKFENYPIKVVLALFNSSLYQFIFQKKFFTHKILRSHLEQLPLPILNTREIQEIIKITDRLTNPKFDKIHRSKIQQDLDNKIFSLFNFSDLEISNITQQVY